MLIKLKDTPANVSGIYKINYPNGKVYIGQAQNIRARIMEHNQRAACIDSTRKIQLCDLALRKYNYIINEYEILEEVQDLSLLDERENYWTQFYDATNREKGYNLLDKGNVSGRRGVDNANAVFNQQELNEIIDLLLFHTELSCLDIAKRYKVDPSTIYRINNGQSYVNAELSYPLRRYNHDSARKNDIQDYFSEEAIILLLKEDLLYRWDLSLENDLTKKYNIPIRVLRDINNGRKFENIGNFTYPIRGKNIRNNNNFTQEDILHILNDLRNTSLSQTYLAEKYNIHRNTIAKINQGQTYPIKDYDYPARK